MTRIVTGCTSAPCTASGVDRHVLADVTALQKALWADGAAEGLVPGVTALMPVQIGLLNESPAAV